MKKTIMLSAALLAGTSAFAQMTPPDGGKAISDELIGIFFEDISMSADGGLNADLVQNGSFEYNMSERDGWGPGTCWRTVRPGHSLGFLEAKQQDPIHPNNPNYVRVHCERTREFYDYKGWRGFGLQNDGFNGMSVKKGAKYDFSFFARNVDPNAKGKKKSATAPEAKEIRVVICKPAEGWGQDPTVLGEATLKVGSTDWKKYESTITVSEDCANAFLQILSLTVGDFDVDMISLMPQDTYHGHGIRKDLAEALEALNPKFMRFPGGCVVHGGGDGFWNTYMWKETVGPKETRRGQKNTWGYHQSMSVGYYEYFQLCEDMGMAPVPILPCGVSCQGTNGGWGMWPKQAQDVCDMKDMDKWTQDALDLIEWANGDVKTKWGKVRADQGHPKPFGLKYLGIGNEEKISPEFIERFKYMYKIITEKHPEIVIVGTAGPGSHPGNPDYEAGWKLADEIGLPIIDEHYYEKKDYFYFSRQYDKYPRDRKTKVYLGEYATQDPAHNKKWSAALGEALYLMHVERNGDVVVMTSYAPLFARQDNTNWNPDLIYYNNDKTFLTCSYYVQQMFGQSSGQYFYDNLVKFSDGDSKFTGSSVVLNTKTKTLFVKMANATPTEVTANVDLSKFEVKANAKITKLQGDPNMENNYDGSPVTPKTEDFTASKQMTVKVAPYSVQMITIQL